MDILFLPMKQGAKANNQGMEHAGGMERRWTRVGSAERSQSIQFNRSGRIRNGKQNWGWASVCLVGKRSSLPSTTNHFEGQEQVLAKYAQIWYTITILADPDVWRRPARRDDGSEYYELCLVYVDDILLVSHDPRPSLLQIVRSMS